MLYSGDLGFGKTEIFLRKGLDRANQLDPAAENRFLAQTIFNPSRRKTLALPLFDEDGDPA
jgi:hypothetical protein